MEGEICTGSRARRMHRTGLALHALVCPGAVFAGPIAGRAADDTDLVVAFSSCLSSATFSALTVAFFFLLLVGIGIAARASLFAAAMVGLGTPIFAYSGWLFSNRCRL